MYIELEIDKEWEKQIHRIMRLDPDYVILIGGRRDELRGALEKLDKAGIPSLRVPKECRSKKNVTSSGQYVMVNTERTDAMHVIECMVNQDWKATIYRALHLDPDYVILIGGRPDELRRALEKVDMAGIPSLRVPESASASPRVRTPRNPRKSGPAERTMIAT